MPLDVPHPITMVINCNVLEASAPPHKLDESARLDTPFLFLSSIVEFY